MTYRHTQRGIVFIAALAMGIVVNLLSAGTTGTAQPIHIGIIGLLGLALFTFLSLTVEIENSTLECRLGIGIIRKTIQLTRVREAQRVRLPWYAGWGVRWIPGQYIIWRVSGLEAVELVMIDGSRFRIGTDQPEELVQAIRKNSTLHQVQS